MQYVDVAEKVMMVNLEFSEYYGDTLLKKNVCLAKIHPHIQTYQRKGLL